MSDILNQEVSQQISQLQLTEEAEMKSQIGLIQKYGGKQAQIAADYVKKGSLIGITGSFKIDSWKDKNTGEDRYKPVVRVDKLNLLGSRKDSDNNQYSNSNNSSEIPF